MKKILFAFVTMLCWCGMSYGITTIDPDTGGPLDPIDPVDRCQQPCPEGYRRNQSTCECECDAACISGYTMNEDTCTCEKNKCQIGAYHDGTGCVPCPGNEGLGTCWTVGDNCVPPLGRMNCGYVSANSGGNGISDCYQRAEVIMSSSPICKYTDDVGTYELSSDCYYAE